jgi:cytochrome c
MKNLIISVSMLATATITQAAAPNDFLVKYEAQSGPSSAERGQKFFTTKHGKEWSCSTCHGKVTKDTGEHVETQKRIKPLAPAFNPKRFTDEAKVEKWFKRNCEDVLGKECSPQQKADVLAWLLSVK